VRQSEDGSVAGKYLTIFELIKSIVFINLMLFNCYTKSFFILFLENIVTF